MKKYKIAVGICGPTILYTNIIRANSPEEAAIIYLRQVAGTPLEVLGVESREEDIKKLVSRMIEIEERAVRNDDDHFVDALGTEIELGQDIVFICRQAKNAIREGKVHAITSSTIAIKSDDKVYRLVSDPEDGLSIRKAIVLDWKKETPNKGIFVDAIGQPLTEGKTVAYRQKVDMENCKGFFYGTILKVTGTYVFIRDMENNKEEVRRRHDLVIVLNKVEK